MESIANMDLDTLDRFGGSAKLTPNIESSFGNSRFREHGKRRKIEWRPKTKFVLSERHAAKLVLLSRVSAEESALGFDGFAAHLSGLSQHEPLTIQGRSRVPRRSEPSHFLPMGFQIVRIE